MRDESLHIDFHFDLMCPWAYQTSKWIREVRQHNGLDIRWKFFSLEEINRAVYDDAMESSFRHPPHQQLLKRQTMIGESLKHRR